jgi:hypothetical protein
VRRQADKNERNGDERRDEKDDGGDAEPDHQFFRQERLNLGQQGVHDRNLTRQWLKGKS